MATEDWYSSDGRAMCSRSKACEFESRQERRENHLLWSELFVAVKFIVEPFRPSDPCLRTVKISARWCRVDASYFTHNWETRGGRERPIPSHAGPKDLPTALLLRINTYQRLSFFLFFYACSTIENSFCILHLPSKGSAFPNSSRFIRWGFHSTSPSPNHLWAPIDVCRDSNLTFVFRSDF